MIFYGETMKKIRIFSLLMLTILALCMLSACGDKKDAETNKEKESMEEQIITELPEDDLKEQGTTGKTDSKKPGNDVEKNNEDDKPENKSDSDTDDNSGKDDDDTDDASGKEDNDTEEENASRKPIVMPGVSLD